MSCSDEDATFVAWVVLFGGFFDSNELKLTRRMQIHSRMLHAHETADPEIAGARFLKTYTDEKTGRADSNFGWGKSGYC